MSSSVPFSQPVINDADIAAVVDTLKSGWIVAGPKAARFEELFREYVDTKYAVAVNSCTAGLQLSLTAAGIGSGDEVITTPLTFVATANAIVNVGAVPVFVDIDAASQNLDPDKIEAAITSRTKAIVPVHMAGTPVAINRVLPIAHRHGLKVIFDAAHAIESTFDGRSVARYGTASIYSFQATKNVTTGDGGMIATDDEEIADYARIARSHGLTKDSWKRYGKSNDSGYDAVLPGVKCSMTDIAASLGISQLARIDANHAVRSRIVAKYSAAFSTSPLAQTLSRPDSLTERDAYHLFMLHLNLDALDVDRDQFAADLKSRGVGCSVHYRSVHLMRYYAERFGFSPGCFPIAEDISMRTLSLPLSAGLTDQQVDQVIATTLEVLESHRR